MHMFNRTIVYIVSSVVGCVPSPETDQDIDGYPQSVDCNDTDARYYPGAPDKEGDETDKSCDGVDGMAPSVGLPSSTVATIQEALAQADNGQVVWVGPGIYREHALTMNGIAVHLRSTHGQKNTIIDGEDKGTVFRFVTGETEQSILDGFTITNGDARNNVATTHAPLNSKGGGIVVYQAYPSIKNVTLTHNKASSGGGLYVRDSSVTIQHTVFIENTAENGAGLFTSNSNVTVNYALFYGNTASAIGGGAYTSDSTAELVHVTFVRNSSGLWGGGVFIDTASLTLSGSVLAYNKAFESGDNIYQYTGVLGITHSLVYSPEEWVGENPSVLRQEYKTIEPMFLTYRYVGSTYSCVPGSSPDCMPTDFHAALNSPLIDAGNPNTFDVDGSHADIGMYGGNGGGSWDLDGDNRFDYFWPGEFSDAPENIIVAKYEQKE